MAEINLFGKRGENVKVLVSDEDFDRVSRHKWYLTSNGKYAARMIHISGSKKYGVVQKGESLHRFIMCAKKGQIIDHINGNGLDNRRGNLRFVTSAQNRWNVNEAKIKKPASGFMGVRQCGPRTFWATVGKRSVGYYRTAEDAAKARDLEALKIRGEFAILNFKKEELPDKIDKLPPKITGPRTSSVRGVSYAKNRRARVKWRVVFNKKHLGWFLTEEEAIQFAKEYKNANKISS